MNNGVLRSLFDDDVASSILLPRLNLHTLFVYQELHTNWLRHVIWMNF